MTAPTMTADELARASAAYAVELTGGDPAFRDWVLVERILNSSAGPTWQAEQHGHVTWDGGRFVADRALCHDDITRAMRAYGGAGGMAVVLRDLVHGGYIDLARTPGAVARVWAGSWNPREDLPRATWVELFRDAGYTDDGIPAERPTETLTLYRGAVPGAARHLAWTTDLSVAMGFAFRGLGDRPRGAVYRAVVPPGGLLAHIAGLGEPDKSESEYVVDPAFLPTRLRAWRTEPSA